MTSPYENNRLEDISRNDKRIMFETYIRNAVLFYAAKENGQESAEEYVLDMMSEGYYIGCMSTLQMYYNKMRKLVKVGLTLASTDPQFQELQNHFEMARYRVSMLRALILLFYNIPVPEKTKILPDAEVFGLLLHKEDYEKYVRDGFLLNRNKEKEHVSLHQFTQKVEKLNLRDDGSDLKAVNDKNNLDNLD